INLRILILSCCLFFILSSFYCSGDHRDLHSFPTRRSSDLELQIYYIIDSFFNNEQYLLIFIAQWFFTRLVFNKTPSFHEKMVFRSEEHTSELQSRFDLVCRLLLEKKKKINNKNFNNTQIKH